MSVRRELRVRLCWYSLFLIQFIGLLWPPFYNRSAPQLAGIPFFYWYQLGFVLIGSATNALVYFGTRTPPTSILGNIDG